MQTVLLCIFEEKRRIFRCHVCLKRIRLAKSAGNKHNPPVQENPLSEFRVWNTGYSDIAAESRTAALWDIVKAKMFRCHREAIFLPL